MTDFFSFLFFQVAGLLPSGFKKSCRRRCSSSARGPSAPTSRSTSLNSTGCALLSVPTRWLPAARLPLSCRRARSRFNKKECKGFAGATPLWNPSYVGFPTGDPMCPPFQTALVFRTSWVRPSGVFLPEHIFSVAQAFIPVALPLFAFHLSSFGSPIYSPLYPQVFSDASTHKEVFAEVEPVVTSVMDGQACS